MTDDPFESRLDHLFAVVDEPADALAFRQALAVRLARDRLVRRWALFGAGVLGAGVAAAVSLPLLPQLWAGASRAAQDAQVWCGKLALPAETAIGATGIDPAMAAWTALSLGVLALAGLMGGLDRLART